MNDATSENAICSEYQRGKAILKRERRVTASLLQRRLGIGYGSALQLAAEFRRGQPGSAVLSDVDLVLNSSTLYLLLEIWHGPRGSSDIGIAKDDLDAFLTGDGVSAKVTVRSVVGKSAGQNPACLAVRNAVDTTSEESAQALHVAKRLILLVSAAPATLMGREIKIILSEFRRLVDESCTISFGIQYLAPSKDDSLCVTVIYSQ